MKILVLYCYKNIANIGLNAFLYIRVIWRFYAVSGKLAKVRRTVAQISSPSAPASYLDKPVHENVSRFVLYKSVKINKIVKDTE